MPIDPTLDLAIEMLFRFFAAALRSPVCAEQPLLADSQSLALVRDAADFLRVEFSSQPIALGFGEVSPQELDLRPTLRELASVGDGLRDEFVRVFGLSTCRECPPYETEFLRVDEPFFRSQQMADIAGFYAAFGLEPSAQSRERADHLATELEFVSVLLAKDRLAEPLAVEAAAVCQEARESFVRDHLAWWVPSFSLALRRRAEHGFYAELGKALAAFLPIERTRLDIPAPCTPLEATFIEPPDVSEGCAACTACA